MRFDGTDTMLMITVPPSSGSAENDSREKQIERFEERFLHDYKHEFGFLLEEKRIVVDDIKVVFALSILSWNKSLIHSC